MVGMDLPQDSQALPGAQPRITPVVSDAQAEEFRLLALPVITWLNANCHPHVTVII